MAEHHPWFECPQPNYVEELSPRSALAGLPEDQREVTVLHIWGGLTFAEAKQQLAADAMAAPELKILADFLASSSRGIVR